MTVKRMRFLQQLLKFVGLDGRLHLEWISSAEAQKFVRVVTEFTERIKALGPNPLAEFNEKIEAMGPRAIAGPESLDISAQKPQPIAAKRKAKMAQN
jgi:F420-non-reducing hydrogenase iron-sulfur subunit